MSCCDNKKLLKNLLEYLGMYVCYDCKGTGVVTYESCKCGCCGTEMHTCTHCKGERFVLEDESILKHTKH